MNIEINNRKKRIILYILPIFVLLILTLSIRYYRISKEKESETDIYENSKKVEESVEEDDEERYIIDSGQDFTELFPIIDEQQAYIVVPGRIDTRKPPTVVIYSHGSNTSVTQNMQDQFMKDMREYGILFSKHNYIFAASNQHGVNWGNSASVEDTLKLKEYIDEIYHPSEKIYLLGFSMGGLPTMNFTTTFPELVSKIALLAPTTKSAEWNRERVEKIMDIDIKIWHGNKDVNVPYSYTLSFVNKLEGLGKEIDFVTVEGKGHFDIDTEYMDEILEFFNS